MLLLESNNTKKRQTNENATKLNAGDKNNRKYKVKVIYNSTVYTKDSKSGHLLDLYYLVL